MKKEIITASQLCKPLGIYSQAVKVAAGQFLFISGMTARDKEGNVVGKGDIKLQTDTILQNMGYLLDNVGATYDNIVKVTVFITDMSHFHEIHEIRSKYFKDNYPASTLVEVSRLASKDHLIEIEAVAIIE